MVLTKSQLKVYRAAYNALIDDVEAAHERLERDPGHIETIRGALRIIKDHDANDYLGLFLLHRHFRCLTGSVFVERRYTPRKGHPAVLVTKGEPAGEAATRIAPHRFAIASDGTVQAVSESCMQSLQLFRFQARLRACGTYQAYTALAARD